MGGEVHKIAPSCLSVIFDELNGLDLMYKIDTLNSAMKRGRPGGEEKEYFG